jgi:hypothetical protein
MVRSLVLVLLFDPSMVTKLPRILISGPLLTLPLIAEVTKGAGLMVNVLIEFWYAFGKILIGKFSPVV